MSATLPIREAEGGYLPHNASNDGADTQQRSRFSLWCEKFKVAIVFSVFVTFRAADRAFLFRVQKYLGNPSYNLILSNIFWPVAIQLMTILMLLGYIVMLRAQGQSQYTWRFFLPGNIAASTMGAVPMSQLALFSLGDQINAAMSAPPSAFVALPMQSILTNFVIIWMVLLASVWLKTRFKQVHYIGCVLIVASAVVGVADKLESNDCTSPGQEVSAAEAAKCLQAYRTSNATYMELSLSSMLLWYGIFIASTVPSAISNCYKQMVLKGRDVDVCYATWWSGNFQVIWGLLLFWINWIPLPDQTADPPSATFKLIGDTWQCFIGNVPNIGDESCAGAGGPAITWFGVYLCFNLSFNICLLWLTKRMSAVWAQIATTLCLALTNIFSQYRFMVGDSAKAMTLCEWLATFLAALALWVYNVEAEIQKDPITAEETKVYTLPGSMASDGRAHLIETLSFHDGGAQHRSEHSSLRNRSLAQSLRHQGS